MCLAWLLIFWPLSSGVRRAPLLMGPNLKYRGQVNLLASGCCLFAELLTTLIWRDLAITARLLSRPQNGAAQSNMPPGSEAEGQA